MSTPTKIETVLLVGRKGSPEVDAQMEAVDVPGVNFIGASTIAGAQAAAAKGPIDHAVIGHVDLGTKLDIIKAILENSPGTTIHLNSETSGPEGFTLFVRRLLKALPAA